MSAEFDMLQAARRELDSLRSALARVTERAEQAERERDEARVDRDHMVELRRRDVKRLGLLESSMGLDAVRLIERAQSAEKRAERLEVEVSLLDKANKTLSEHRKHYEAERDAAIKERDELIAATTKGPPDADVMEQTVVALATKIAADTEQRVVERVAAWLRGKARYFVHNRNLGPYSDELADQVEHRVWLEPDKDDEHDPPFDSTPCRFCGEDHSKKEQSGE